MNNTSGTLQPSAILPSKGIAAAIIVGQRVADLVIGKADTTIRSQQVAPTIGVAIGIGAIQRGGGRACDGPIEVRLMLV